MTPEQRETLETWAQVEGCMKSPRPLSEAIRAALAEIEALRKEVDDSDKFIDDLDIIIGAPRQSASRACVVEDAVKALVKDRERLDKYERLHDDGPWPDVRERRAPDSETRIWVFRRSRRSLSFETCRTLREAIDAIPEEPCRS